MSENTFIKVKYHVQAYREQVMESELKVHQYFAFYFLTRFRNS